MCLCDEHTLFKTILILYLLTGSTAGTIYYDQQIQDTLGVLFQLISSRASLELRQCLITAMKQIMKKNRAILLNSDGKTRQFRVVPAVVILPNLNLLLDADPSM